MKIRIATRGSELALVQSRWVAGELEKLGMQTELVIIKTQGDLLLDKPLHEIGGKGLFTKEVDRAVLENEADLSVHSLKDMPVEDEEGLMLGAIPKRESCDDVLVLNNNGESKIGCGSLRRRSQIARLDLGYSFEGVRGNIHTRLEKMKENDWVGLVVAEAALKRLGLDSEYEYKKLEILPAAGQGALGLRIRDNDRAVSEIVGKLSSREAFISASAESEFLKCLGGGCHLPAGIKSVLSGNRISFVGGVFSVSGDEGIVAEEEGDIGDAKSLAVNLAQTILNMGGKEILDRTVE